MEDLDFLTLVLDRQIIDLRSLCLESTENENLENVNQKIVYDLLQKISVWTSRVNSYDR